MIIRSTGIPLPIDNIDTDQIIPAPFLKLTTKEGYGKNLFYNWRYLSDYKINKEFILNQNQYKEGGIIIAGNNFGCGSSREHAAWALADYGIQVVISTQFADIFKGNAYNNNILPVELRIDEVDSLMEMVQNTPTSEITVDLKSQSVIAGDINFKANFEINSFKKECLLAGVDETEYLIKLRPEIEAFEMK